MSRQNNLWQSVGDCTRVYEQGLAAAQAGLDRVAFAAARAGGHGLSLAQLAEPARPSN